MQDNGFKFTYSAKEQEEIKNIRKKYINEEEDSIQRLRRLDKNVTSKANIVSLIIGILGTLIMGAGMSLIMTDIGDRLGMNHIMVIGIVVGIIGLTVAITAYPIYNRIVKSEREKIAPEILRLTEELMK